MSWILLSVGAAFLWAVTNVVDKYVISKLVSKPVLPSIVLGVVGAIASGVVFLVKGFEPLASGSVVVALVAGVLYAGQIYLYFQAVKFGEISRLIPLFYLAPLFILILAALFLGEIFTPLKYTGIVLLVLGAMLISVHGSGTFRFNTGFWLVVLAAFLSAVSHVMTKHLLGEADFWTIFGYKGAGTFIAFVPALILCWKDFGQLYRERGGGPFALMSLSEVLNQIAILAITAATAIGFVTLVNALSSIQAFLLLLMTIGMSMLYPHILEEEIGRSTVTIKVIAIALMFIGALLVS